MRRTRREFLLSSTAIGAAAGAWAAKASARPSSGFRGRGGGAVPPGFITSFNFGTPFKYNSGYPSKFINSDVWSNTWADDDNIYAAHDDCLGWQGTSTSGPTTSNMAWSLLSSYTTGLTGTAVNLMASWGQSNTPGSDGGTFKAMGVISVQGLQYIWACRQFYPNWSLGGARQTSTTAQLIKTSDHGVTWTPIPPGGGLPAQAYVSPMFTSANFACPFFIQYGKDYVGQTVHNSNLYVYATSTNGFWNNGDSMYLGRCLISNLPNLSAADWSFYQGGDGMLSGNWGALGSAVPLLTSGSKTIGSNGIQYLPALGCYVFIDWWYPSVSAGTTVNFPNLTQWNVYQSPTPWGPWSFVSTISWNTEPGNGLYNPNVMPKSVSADGGRTVQVTCGGNFDNQDFSTGDYTLTLVPATIT